MGEEAVDYLTRNTTAALLLEAKPEIDLSNEQNGTDCDSRRCDAAPRFRRECEPSLRHFVIELESGAAASTVQNTAR